MTIDTATIAFMQSIQNPVLTSFSKSISVVFDPIILIVLTFVISTHLYLKKQKKQAVFFTSTILVAGILIKLLKAVFHRARPLNILIQETGYSFPSGHATIAVVFFGGLTFLLLKDRKQKIKLPLILSTVTITLISGFTRLYLRVHWFTDVLAGFILGGIVLVSGIIFYKKINFIS